MGMKRIRVLTYIVFLLYIFTINARELLSWHPNG